MDGAEEKTSLLDRFPPNLERTYHLGQYERQGFLKINGRKLMALIF